MKYLKRFVDILLVIYLLTLAAVSVPVLFGFRVYTVVSQSMAPAITVGSAVYVKKTAFDQISEGDVITYSFANNTTVTHRVWKKDTETASVITKGDANEQPDGTTVPREHIIGVVRFHVPYLGYAAIMLGSVGEKLLLAGGLVWLLLMQGILTNILEIRQKGVNII